MYKKKDSSVIITLEKCRSLIYLANAEMFKTVKGLSNMFCHLHTYSINWYYIFIRLYELFPQ